jgi:hypothetical protein
MSRLSHSAMNIAEVDITQVTSDREDSLITSKPGRGAVIAIAPDPTARADASIERLGHRA